MVLLNVVTPLLFAKYAYENGYGLLGHLLLPSPFIEYSVNGLLQSAFYVHKYDFLSFLASKLIEPNVLC